MIICVSKNVIKEVIIWINKVNYRKKTEGKIMGGTRSLALRKNSPIKQIFYGGYEKK
jgi:hypothetical protein